MRLLDQLRFATAVLARHRLRSAMLLLVTTLGVAAVVVLTALGQGARGYVVEQFAFIGNDVLVMLPGRKETSGGLPPVTGSAARDLTLEDAQFLLRRLPQLRDAAPLVIGSAAVSYQQRSRDVFVLGTVPGFIELRRLKLAQGSNLPAGDWRRGRPQVIVGGKLAAELFGSERPIGQWLRIGDSRFRVVGVLQGRGDAMGMDLSDVAIIPVASAQQLFNAPSLFRLLLRVQPGTDLERVRRQLGALIRERHQGEEDVTIVSPDAVLEAFDEVLLAMTAAVAVIAAISLLVAGVLVMNVTWINVSQRVAEIGLLKALGAPGGLVQRLFVTEAVLVAGAGTVLGVLAGYGAVALLRGLFPEVPFAPPTWAVVLAVLLALLCGIGFALLPATRASRQAPVDALRSGGA